MIGNVLQKARKEKGLTQEQFGSLVGRKKQSISNIEMGHVGLSIKNAVRFAEALKVDPAIFLPTNSRKS